MFGTLGFSELIIILVIVLIIFGAGRLPGIGEGLGKALKGFKKEVHETPPEGQIAAQGNAAPTIPPADDAHVITTAQAASATPVAPPTSTPTAPYQPGPELTPGTTAAILAAGAGPQLPKAPPVKPAPQPATASAAAQHHPTGTAPPPQAVYPPLPPGTQSKAPPKRPSAVVNKAAVARVQAQQAAMKGQPPAGQPAAGVTPKDMQGLGESLGDALRTFRQAATDVRNSIDPSMRTIQAEMDAAQKEIEQSMEAAKQRPAPPDDSSKTG